MASWVDARAHDGVWLIRIEDIDPPRDIAGADQQILDLLKKICIGFTSPQEEMVAKFNQLTQSGKEMSHYQELLERAVAALAGKQQEQGVKSLFQRGGIRLAGESDRSVNDFEVVAFVALMRERK